MNTKYKVGVVGAVGAAIAAFLVGELTGTNQASAVNPDPLATNQVSLARSVALAAASADGDATPSAITAVATTRSTAVRFMGGDDTVAPDQAALAILVKGNFSTGAFSLPPGVKAIPFDELVLVIDATSGQTLNVFSADTATKPINLATLGTPTAIQ